MADGRIVFTGANLFDGENGESPGLEVGRNHRLEGLSAGGEGNSRDIGPGGSFEEVVVRPWPDVNQPDPGLRLGLTRRPHPLPLGKTS